MRTASLALALAGVFLAGSASAATSTGAFQVTATVSASCVVTSTVAVAFPVYDPANTHFAANDDATGTINVRCTKGTAPVITLDEGLPANKAAGSTCTSPARQMASGADRLPYFLYQDTGRTTVWGCTSGTNSLTLAAAPSNAARAVTVYGRIPANQDVNTGSYADTVTATLTF